MADASPFLKRLQELNAQRPATKRAPFRPMDGATEQRSEALLSLLIGGPRTTADLFSRSGMPLNEYTETLAAACGTTNFVQGQHLSACTLISAAPNDELKERLLPEFASGRRIARSVRSIVLPVESTRKTCVVSVASFAAVSTSIVMKKCVLGLTAIPELISS